MPRPVPMATKERFENRHMGRPKRFDLIIDNYVDKILSGEVPSRPHWFRMCERFREDTQRPDIFYDRDFLNEICTLLEHFPVPDGVAPDENGHYPCLRLFKYQILYFANTRCLFWNWGEKDDLKYSMDVESFIRKAGKSALKGFDGVLDLIYKPSGYITICSANTLAQAKFAFETACKMISYYFIDTTGSKNKSLPNEWGFKFEMTQKELRRFDKTGRESKMYPIAMNPEKADGLRGTHIMADEIAKMTGSGEDFYETLKTGQMNMKNPRFSSITTAGDVKAGLAWDVMETAIEALYQPLKIKKEGWESHPDTIHDKDNIFCMISMGSEEDIDNWDKPEVWRAVNPVYDENPEIVKNMRNSVASAMKSPKSKRKFIRDNLNVWGINQRAFFDVESIRPEKHEYEIQKFAKKHPKAEWVIGLDTADREDLCAFTLIAMVEEQGQEHFYFWSKALLPEITAETGRNNAIYEKFIQAGELELVDTDTITFEKIREVILNWTGMTGAKEVIADRYNFDSVKKAFKNTDIVIDQSKGDNRANHNSAREINAYFKEKRLHHDGSDCFLWCLGNLEKMRELSGIVFLDKSSEYKKIDLYDSLKVGLSKWLLVENKRDKVITPAKPISSGKEEGKPFDPTARFRNR